MRAILLAALACTFYVLAAKEAAGQRPRRAPVQGAATTRAIPEEIMLRIVRAEDERRWDEADLGALLSDKNARVRWRAALAAGRFGDESAVPRLVSLLLKDQDTSVRAMAAFALGEIESASGADALIEALRTSSGTEVRTRVIEALGKIAAALPKPDEARKNMLGEVILGALESERKRTQPQRAIMLAALTAALRARPPNAGKIVGLFLSLPDARVRADAANALARLRAKDANDQLRALLTNDADAVVRANAVRALGATADQASVEMLIERGTNDADDRVRVSAIRALAALGNARAAVPLLNRGDTLVVAYRAAKESGVKHPRETNELLDIATTLGRVLTNTGDGRAISWLRVLSVAEGGAAPEMEIAFARIAPAQYLREQQKTLLDRAARAKLSLQWQSVSSIAQALGEIAAVMSATGGNSAISTQADALVMLRSLLNDPGTPALAMPDVLRALAAFKPDNLRAVLRAKLGAPDVIVRATAAELLGEMTPDDATAHALAVALPVALRDEMNDAAIAILNALGKQKSSEASEAIRSAREVPDYLVRRRAAALLQETKHTGASNGQVSTETVATRNRLTDYRRALARLGKRVRAQVTTDKGKFTIELLPHHAPLTVDNFVELARRSFFNNLTFHRVVPNFVIQGGDPRGDGNGGPGYQIRCEINEVPYDRGAVGMALSGKDTGGSQWFVTHSPQPHLDGGYTLFGRVVEGMNVVDNVARGDHIISINVIEGKPSAISRQRSASRNR